MDNMYIKMYINPKDSFKELMQCVKSTTLIVRKMDGSQLVYSNK